MKCMKTLQTLTTVVVFFSLGAAVVNPWWLLVAFAATSLAIVISG